MGLKEKLQKFKESRLLEASDADKTGVLNAITLLSAALGALGLLSTVEAATPCVNEWSNAIDTSSVSKWSNNWSNWSDWGDWNDWNDWSDGP